MSISVSIPYRVHAMRPDFSWMVKSGMEFQFLIGFMQSFLNGLKKSRETLFFKFQFLIGFMQFNVISNLLLFILRSLFQFLIGFMQYIGHLISMCFSLV